MKVLTKKPHFYFFITSIFILTCGYYNYIKLSDSALDINVHDTYFVIAHFHSVIVLFSFYGLIGIIYFVFKVLKIQLKTLLTTIHTTVTVSVVYIYLIINYFLSDSIEKELIHGNIQSQNNLILFLSICVFAAQILFIFNLIIGSIKHFRKRNEI
ncbi:cbb3-type cytochrome c oxidase subunit I [uncultured Winogradskyella sp.]|uniref:cbb3-type cytochrome c oxidase subunit I n=1 Tax=uncultured Winogradskyella sp. TaxID=395353 RepID=UPI00261B1239|nr:cbb3-type cytochrome c oxidase subunit I [uncultured Winogradskyella sp.]